MGELNPSDLELSFKINDEQFKKILPTTIDAESEYTLGVDYGNGISKQIKGQFYVNVHYRYKKHKKGKKYKYFKVKRCFTFKQFRICG